jgi:hypothetical protein
MKTPGEIFLEQIVLKQIEGSVYLLPAVTDIQIQELLTNQKQAIVDAYREGAKVAKEECEGRYVNLDKDAEQYYNDKYKTND